MDRYIVCMPVYNDWESAGQLVPALGNALRRDGIQAGIVLVDDGSTVDAAPGAIRRPDGIESVEIVRLRRNVGHQRAIAIGLAHIAARNEPVTVIVMDADGEDPPEGVLELIRAHQAGKTPSVVFAQRRRRVEGPVFKTCYALYKALHRALVGRGIEVGNFSLVPWDCLQRLIVVSEMWNHYAASIYHARLPLQLVPIDRAQRIAGKSKMNFVSLVVHGLSAIAVYSDVVAVRMLVAVSVLMAAIGAAAVGTLAAQFSRGISVPAWAGAIMGIFAVALLQLLSLAAFGVMMVLRSRTELGFIPCRDYAYFISEVTRVE